MRSYESNSSWLSYHKFRTPEKYLKIHNRPCSALSTTPPRILCSCYTSKVNGGLFQKRKSVTKLQNVLLVWSVYTYRHQKQTNQHFESSNSHTNDYFMHTLHRVHSLIKLFLSLPAADWLFFLLQGFNNFRHQVWKEWKSNCQSPGLLPVWKSARKLSSKASHLSTIVEKFVQYYMST